MKKILIVLVLGLSLFANDVIVKETTCSVDKTVKNLKDIIRAKNLSIFAIVNHHGNAKAVDMKLPQAKMIMFGNPKIGTALMQQDMLVGLDLPIRILVYTDKDSKVKIAYRDGSWLATKHVLNAATKINKLNNVLDQMTRKAGTCKKD